MNALMMKETFSVIISVFLCWSLFALSAAARAEGRAPVPIILDTDLAYDVDDAGAVAVAHALADRGEAKLLATAISQPEPPESALCLNAMNVYFGRGDLPVGMAGEGVRTVSRYAAAVARAFPCTIDSPEDVPGTVDVYRRVLAGQPDSSVVMISVGYVTNFANLLRSEPDEYSDLDGRELVERKVRKWVCMGGPHNLGNDVDASVYAVGNWPTPIVFSPSEIGPHIRTGRRLRMLPEDNPIRLAYRRWNNLRSHSSWDQAAVLYAVRGIDDGPASDYWELARGRKTVSKRNGRLRRSWRDDPEGAHYYKTGFQRSARLIGDEIERLMMHLPHRAVNILRPAPLETMAPDEAAIELETDPERGAVREITLYSGDNRIGSLTDEPWQWTWADPGPGLHALSARVVFEDDSQCESHAVWIYVLEEDVPASLPGVQEGLIAWYPINEGLGRTLRERSGSGLAPDMLLDLRIPREQSYPWLAGGAGVRFGADRPSDWTSGGHEWARNMHRNYGYVYPPALSAEPARRLNKRLKETGELTVKMWLNPDGLDQSGPAAIVSLSDTGGKENLTIGQGAAGEEGAGARLTVRLRTGEDGMSEVVAEDAVVEGLAQYVVTYDGEVVSVYRDGEKLHAESVEGDLSGWAEDCLLAFGSEAGGEHPWVGRLHRVAVYDRALGDEEVEHSGRPVFDVQPAGAVVGSPLSPAVTVRIVDKDGNLMEDSTAEVRLSIGSDPSEGSARLGGTLSREAVGGVAGFDDLSIDAAGEGYTLQATAEGLTATESETFDISAGSGTEADPWLVATLDDLQRIGSGREYGGGTWGLGDHYVLISDIDASATANWNGGAGFEAIGRWSGRAFFSGTFDGRGHIITGLHINRPNNNDQGLFGWMGDDAVVKNVGLRDVNIRGRDCVGGLAGSNRGAVKNSYTTGEVTASSEEFGAGGLIGMAHRARIIDSYSLVNVNSQNNVGGLIGRVYGGGTRVIRSFSAGGVSGESNVSGLVGSGSPQVTGSFWDVETSGQESSAGGVAKTAADMKDIGTFLEAGWDIASGEEWDGETWLIDDGEAYPRLGWERQ